MPMPEQSHSQSQSQSHSVSPAIFAGVSVLTAVAVAVLHTWENHIYLLHLHRIPDVALAQAAALQTENAFYYSYYTELVRADTVVQGLSDIIWDRRSEYPDVLNAIRRFNIYQELVLALEYRLLGSLGLAGRLDPWHFFRYHILVLNGVGHGFLALLAADMSGNPLAGAACFLVSVLNRFQISRLGNYSSSNLRELWGIPVLWIQTWLLWYLLRWHGSSRPRGRALLWVSFVLTTFIFIVVWQFSPFLLLLQVTAVYFVYLVCGYWALEPTVLALLDAYLLALAGAVVVHFGSPYLLTSPFLFQLLALRTATTLRRCLRRCSGAPARSEARSCCMNVLPWARRRCGDLLQGLLALLFFALLLKAAAPFATADTHVYEILCTKASAINDLLPASLRLGQHRLPECSEPSFNARLYLIMGVFNLLERQSLEVYSSTLASPAAALSTALILLRCCMTSFRGNADNRSGNVQGPHKVPLEDEATMTAGTTKPGPGPGEGGLRRRKAGRMVGASTRPSTQDKEVMKSGNISSDLPEDGLNEALLFVVVQTLLFLCLGGLINRLRVAFGPPLMVLASCCFGPQLFPSRWLLKRHGLATRLVLFGLFASHVVWMLLKLPCIGDKEGVCQHFSDKSSSDGDLADLCHWMNEGLDPSTPVLSSMNLAGSLRLFTSVPMVVHPQFESENLRKRVQRGYELYHCGSEESFAETMRQLHAEVVIFEYNRCFFTPYLLDDRRKNCDARKHKAEDQLCLKLHARPRHFQRLFSNGGYAVFRLRPEPLGLPELPASAVAAALETSEAWRDYANDCLQNQGALCGPRLLETAATWEHTMKRKRVATVLRRLGDRLFPQEGHVAYYLARYLDYEANQPQRAREYYEKAVAILPNNPIILKEYLMFLDLSLKDTRSLESLLRERKQRTGAGVKAKTTIGAGGPNPSPLPLLELEGPGVGVLLCEASVSAKNTPGLEAFGEQLWAKARRLAPLSDCVRTNWQIIYGEASTFEASHGRWEMLRIMASGGLQQEVSSHNEPAIRFLGSNNFNLQRWSNPNRSTR